MNGIDRDTEAYVNTLSNEECLTLWTTGSLWDAQSNPLAQALARRALADPPLREAFLNATPKSRNRDAAVSLFKAKKASELAINYGLGVHLFFLR